MVEIYTDASFIRPGGHQNTLHKKSKFGWAFVVVYNDKEIYNSYGRLRKTTDSILVELRAVIEALNSAHSVNSIIWTDCQHVVRLFQGEKIKHFNKPCVIKAKERVKNINTRVQWLESHTGNKWSTRADTLARNAIGLSSSDAWGVL